jgi:intein/homing endonuclease
LKATNWDGTDPGDIHVAEGTSTTGGTSDGFRISSENWSRFMGWFDSEGYAYCPSGRYQYITGICQDKEKNPENYSRITSLLDDIGVKYQTCSDEVRIYHKGLYTRLKKLGGANEKYIPSQVKNMPVGHLQALLNTLVKGDGYEYVNEETYHHGSVGYHTASRDLADDVQEIAIKSGKAANIKKDHRPEKYENDVCYYLSLSDRKYAPWVNWSDESKKSQTEKWVGYEGKAYGAVVPNGTLVVRRNDKPVVGGDSRTNRSQIS